MKWGRDREPPPGIARFPRCPRAIALVVLFLILAAGMAPLAALPHESEIWIRVDTANFTLFSNVSEKQTVAIGRQFELFRGILAGLNPGLAINSPLPTYVFVFRTDRSFEPYKTRFGAGPTSQDAYFSADRDANYVAMNATPEGDWFAPVYHEFVHYLLNNNFSNVPLWFNEGLAEYYSTFRLTDGDRAEIGREVERSADWLRRQRMLPLSRLFEITVGSPDYNEEDRQGGFYAQAWVLVHYLLWGEPNWRADLADRVASLDAGEPLIGLVPYATLGELQDDLAAYVRVGRYRSTLVDVGSIEVDPAAKVNPISRAEAISRLGDLLARIDAGKERQAERHFQEAIRLDPTHAASYAGLGFLRDRDGRHDEASRYYEKALSLDPDDFMTCFLYATNLSIVALGEDTSLAPITEETPHDLIRSRQLFRRSLKLRPGLAEAHAGLGATYLVEAGDLEEGIAALETARRLLPSRMDVVFHLMQLYARGGRRDRAQALMEEVLSRHASPERLAMASEMLLQADRMRAETLITQGRHQEGMKLLEQARAATDDPDLKARLDRQIRGIRAWLENRQQVEQANRQIALFNEAVKRARASDLEGAVDILERVVRDARDEKLRNRARDLLREIEASRPR